MTTIQLKRILTPGGIPSNSQLVLGELCVNVADGKIYLELTDGRVICVGWDIAGFATAVQGALAETALQPGAAIANIASLQSGLNLKQNISELGSAAFVATSTFATAAQGLKANSSLQPATAVSLTSLTTSGTINAGDRIAAPEITASVYRNNTSAGMNIAALSTELRTGRGTGTGAQGDLLFTTADQVAAGSIVQPVTAKMTIKGRGAVLVGSTLDNGVDRLQVSGSASFSGSIKLASFTVATIPSAAANTGGTIYCSNESGGATPAFSDGVNWRRVHDRAIISS